jgi:DNA-binding PadR family transcriptional regulator
MDEIPTTGIWPPLLSQSAQSRGLHAVHLFAIIEEMRKDRYLGEMELMVLLTLVRLGDDAYGVPISKELLNLAGREVALGSIYAALNRLYQKGFVTSTLGDPTPERGGRAKRYFRVTSAGLRALKMTRTALINLWSGIPQLEGRRT